MKRNHTYTHLGINVKAHLSCILGENSKSRFHIVIEIHTQKNVFSQLNPADIHLLVAANVRRTGIRQSQLKADLPEVGDFHDS